MMKNLIIVLVAVIGFTACQNADTKAGGEQKPDVQNEQAKGDSANLTTVKWIDSTFQDLGKVKEGQIVEVSFPFENTGTKNLVFSQVTPGCGCTTPDKPEKPYMPGETGVIKAKFDSKGQHPGEHTKYVTVTANTSPSETTQLTFRVEVIK